MIGNMLLSRYHITELLGGGGFSDTYLAKDIALPGEPYCVVKHLCPKEQQQGILQVAQQLFEREAKVQYQLSQNPQIPTLFAHFEQDNQFFLVQEYIEGHDIAEELIEGQSMNEASALTLVHDILTALAILHDEQCIHRDLKPHNLRRRSRDQNIILIDFGAVKEIRHLTLLPNGETSRTVAIGSPGYMPAEQVAGKPKLASDIYAVGMIGIHAVTGHSPMYFDEDPMTGELLWQHEARICDDFKAVLRKMTHPYHMNRYANAREALAAIKEISLKNPEITQPMRAIADPTTQIQGTQIATQVNQKSGAANVAPYRKRYILIAIIAAIALTTITLTPIIFPWLDDNISLLVSGRPSPTRAVKQYYQGINDRQLSTTWKQLTASKQSEGGGFKSYLEWWNQVDSVHIKEIELISKTSETATVKVELWYGMKNGEATQELKTLFSLIWDSSRQTWMINAVE